MGFIYKITNKVNGKIYVGCSKKDTINQRYGKNLSRLVRESNRCVLGNIIRPLILAVKKYGVENFKIEIIEDRVPINDLSEKEIFYINHYDSWIEGNGYNVSDNRYSGNRCHDLKELSDKMTKINEYYNFNTNETFRGSRHEMNKKFGMNVCQLSSLSSGVKKCLNGWCISSNKYKNFESDGYYYFHNKDSRETLLLKKYQLIEKYPDLNSGALSQLCLRRSLKTYKGWVVLNHGADILEQLKEPTIEIWDNLCKKDILLKSRKEVRDFISTNRLGSKFRDMIKGKRKKYRNYCLIENKDIVFKNRVWKNAETGEEFFGTAGEMTKKYIGDKTVGSSFYMIAKKQTGFISCNGWYINEAEN